MPVNNKVTKTGQFVIAPNVASANLIANQAFYRHEALRIVYGASSTLTAPPTGPYVQGQSYLIRAASPTGDWTGLSGHIVYWWANHWCIIPPMLGMTVTDKSNGRTYLYKASVWRCIRGTYDAGAISSGSLVLNCSEGTVFFIDMNGAFTLSQPTNMIDGIMYQIIVHNDSGSNRVLTFATSGWIYSSSSTTVVNNQRMYIRFVQYNNNTQGLITHVQSGPKRV